MKLLIAVAVLVLAGAGFFLLSPPPKEEWSLSPTGLLLYKGFSSPPHTLTPLPDGSKKIVFQSRGSPISALLSLPEGKGPFPAFVVLPGGNVKKEAEHNGLAKDLRSLGFATLTLDQRGIGETGGEFPPVETQLLSFLNRNEPPYHKMVADALNAIELLRSLPNINKEKIYLAGVSMGGRTAIIAASQSPQIKGILAVSTGGFPLPANLPETQQKFLSSINPNQYVKEISPRPLLMIHSLNDSVVPFSAAQQTFSLAREPKTLFTSEEGGHGYYSSPHRQFLEQALPSWR